MALDREPMDYVTLARKKQEKIAASRELVMPTPELEDKASAFVDYLIGTHAMIPSFCDMKYGQRQYFVQEAALGTAAWFKEHADGNR